MAAVVVALMVVAGGASYFAGATNAGTTTLTATSTTTSTFTQQAQTITQSITQTSTLTNTQTSTSTITTTASPVNFAFVPQPKTGRASNFTRLFDVPPPSTAKIRFLNFNTTDGVNLNGLLVEPQNPTASTFAILAITGRGANYTSMIKLFAPQFVSYGFAFLSIDPRGHDNNAFKDNFDGTYNDLGAGFAILKSLGYSNIILMGWSFGGMQVPAFAAVTHDPAIKAVVLVEAVANLPAKTQYGCVVVYKDPTLCSKIYSDARSLMSQGKPYAILPETVPQAWSTGRVNMSAICYMTEFSPEATPTTSFIRQVSVPVFIGRVSSDAGVPDFEAQWLLNNATAPGSQVPSAEYVLVPDPSGKAGHIIAGTSVRLAYADAIHQWLQGQKIGP